MKPYASYKASGVAWLGDVPSHWRIEKVKFQAHLRGEKAVGTNGVRYVGMEHVLSKVGKFNPVVEGTQEEAESTVNVFAKGDVLFGKLRPYLAKCVVADTDGVCSSEFLVLSPADDVVPAYLNATMLMQEFIDAVDASTYGAKMPRADWGFIGQQRLPLPPPDEQQAIADYLDTETARIDDLILEKEELIGLLREWRQSVIAEAVTKGLDNDVTMKPSGVAWLGDVPGHWEVKQARFVMTCNDDVLPEHTNPEQLLDYIEISDVDEVSGIKGFESIKFSDAPSRARRLVMEGDVIVSTVRTYLRAVAAISNPTAETVVSTGFAVLRPRTIESRYAKYAILYDGFISQVISRSKGISYPAINTTDLVRISVPLPPLDEQQAIADYLDTETARIDNLITHTQEEITLLKELRAATIADAVLGRVDVRDHQKQ